MKIAPRSTRPNNMMTRRKLNGLDCIKFSYLQASVGFIVTEESKIEMRDLDHAKPVSKFEMDATAAASRAFCVHFWLSSWSRNWCNTA